MASQAAKKIDSNNSYDIVPYDSYPYTYTSPIHLKTLAKLFGLESPNIETARILELGCAGGGNIIPHSINYPKAQFVGIDLSQVQIDAANNIKQALELKNIEFRCKSITDITNEDSKFDYIICHGIISWVPDSVREKIFKICKDNLSENGLAQISYNALPGWNMIRSIRDMMLYHAKTFAGTQEKIHQSRLLLNFIKDSLEGSNSAYAEILKTEAELLSKQSDNYLRHDHLEEENKQYYFKEFMEEASKYDLQYLADATLSSMYIGNMPQVVAEKLAAIKDIVRAEQYMDFITNRRFRSTLLCHNSINLNRNINTEDVKKFYTAFYIVPEKPLAEINLNSKEIAKFYFKNNKDSEITIASPCLKAIFYAYSTKLNHNFSFKELTRLASDKLPSHTIAEIEKEFLNHIMHLVLQGYISISLQQDLSPDLSKPKLNKLALYQTSKLAQLWVTNLRHEVIALSAIEKLIFSYMDGENSGAKLIELITLHVDRGEINIAKEGRKLEKQGEIQQEVSIAVDEAINKAANNNLLT